LFDISKKGFYFHHCTIYAIILDLLGGIHEHQNSGALFMKSFSLFYFEIEDFNLGPNLIREKIFNLNC